jgi:putative DNA primase/helicase
MSAGGFSTFAPASSPEELARFDLNDFGNAMRLIRLSGGTIGDDGEVETGSCTLLYLMGSGWIGFNGRCWDRKFGEQLARRQAHRVAQSVRGASAAFLARGVNLKDFWKWADGCGSAGSTSAMLRQAESYLTVELEAFDRDPLAINCRNGTVKLRVRDGQLKAKLHRHDPADRITRMAEVEFDPKASCALFESTAQASLPLDEDRAFFRRACGYGATGFTHEQAMFLAQGLGRDGKSTLLDAVRETLGSYASVGNVLTFLDGGMRSGGEHSSDLMALAGDTRFVLLSEPQRGSKLNEGLIKGWTSGVPITARELREKATSFKPVGKLFMECNALPVTRGDDDGIWRRLKPVLFRHQVPEDRIDRRLPEKLMGERAGILNWLIAGISDWLAPAAVDGQPAPVGLRPPGSVTQALDDYRKRSSPFGDWFAERCVRETGARELSRDLYADFKEWMEGQGHDKVMSQRAFGDALADRQVLLAGKNAQGQKYRGPVRLRGKFEAGPADASSGGFGAGGGSGFAIPADEDSPFDSEGNGQ